MKNRILIIVNLLIFSIILLVFGSYCPIEHILGIPCPGCGLFSAIYWILKGNIEYALYFNPMVIILIPYLILIIFYIVKEGINFTNIKFVKIISIMFFFLLTITYLYRMITIFPEAPLTINTESILFKITNSIN